MLNTPPGTLIDDVKVFGDFRQNFSNHGAYYLELIFFSAKHVDIGYESFGDALNILQQDLYLHIENHGAYYVDLIFSGVNT